LEEFRNPDERPTALSHHAEALSLIGFIDTGNLYDKGEFDPTGCAQVWAQAFGT